MHIAVEASVLFYELAVYEADVIFALPDVFVAGNQKEYGAKKISIHGHTILLVSVPKFSQTKSLIRISLKELKCQVISFDTELDPDWIDR